MKRREARILQIVQTIFAVGQRVEDDPNELIRHRAQQLVPCPSTFWKILNNDLGLCPYKIQLLHELKPQDHTAHLITDLLKETFNERII